MTVTTVFKRFCAGSGFCFHPLGQSSFLGLVSGHYGKWPVFCHISGTVLRFSSLLPVTVPSAKQADVLSFLNRVNWKTTVGNLEMDPAAGEVRFRSSLDCADGKLTPAMVGVLLFRSLSTCDHCLPGLLRILFADASPADAFQSIEAKKADDGEAFEPDLDEGDLRDLLDDVDLDQLPDRGDD
jgi:hypothetical protein